MSESESDKQTGAWVKVISIKPEKDYFVVCVAFNFGWNIELEDEHGNSLGESPVTAIINVGDLDPSTYEEALQGVKERLILTLDEWKGHCDNIK